MTDSGLPKPPGGSGAPGRKPRHSEIVPKAGTVQSTSGEAAASLLLRALRAGDAVSRQAFANAGLSRLEREPEDGELRALLLRQLYLVELEIGDCRTALSLAEEMVELEELGDVARQDAARAAVGLGLIDVAGAHLEIAAQVCPKSRRAFHWATLGALLRFEGRPIQAVEAFQRAVQSAESDHLLYQAQLALAEKAAGLPRLEELRALLHRLEEAPPARGYTLWVMGELYAELGQEEKSRDYLTHFLERMTDAPRAKTLALRGELAHAEVLLRRISS